MRKTRSRLRATFLTSPGRWWRNIAMPSVPLLACFLGGATEKWSEGVIVALLGFILLLDPPRFSLGRNLNLVLLALIACAAIAFLPANWFFRPPWRAALENDLGIQLAGLVSPQPWISLGCFISLLAGMSWLYYVCALDLELREVRQQMRFFSTGIILLAALSIALYKAHITLPFWDSPRGFGPFPNRNQTANLFSLTAIVILACGQDDIRHSRKRWMAWLLGFAVVVAAIVYDFSRAGILILLIGGALWLAFLVQCQTSVTRVALGFSALLISLSAILIFGGGVLERFHLQPGIETDVGPDFRWAILHDSLALVRASPWCGIGMGNFGDLFPMFREASLSGGRVVHPQSDWFWLWVEAGWPALLLAVVGLAILVWRVFPLQQGTNQRFRFAALLATIFFALHGLLDVSGHQVGTAFSGIFFVGMMLRRPNELAASKWIPRLFRLMALLFIAAGIAWVVATRFEKSLPGAIGVASEMHKAAAAQQGRNFRESIERTTGAIDWAPLNWRLYFARALARIGAKQPSEEALADFKRASFLQPNAYEVLYDEGLAWLQVNPSLAFEAWNEALQRVQGSRSEVYAQMLAVAARRNAAVRRDLERIGVDQPDLAVVYLRSTKNQDFATALDRLLGHDPDLKAFSDDEKIALFSLWAERGDLERLALLVKSHPDWMSYAWRAVAKYHANRYEFETAFGLVREFGKTPPLPKVLGNPSIDMLQRAYLSVPDDSVTGYQLYRAQMNERKIDEALATVRHFTALPGFPRYFHFLEAEAWAAKGNWERAWKSWEQM